MKDLKLEQLRNYRETEDFIFFYGSGYSQWFPCKITDVEGNVFPTSEHFMMYHKAKLFGDTGVMQKVFKTPRPEDVKKLGREVKNFNAQLWDKNKEYIVTLGNYYKFTQNPEYQKLLYLSGNKEIVEASPYDKIWGIGLAVSDDRVLDKFNWQGENLLGECIMTVREIVRNPKTKTKVVKLLEETLYRF